MFHDVHGLESLPKKPGNSELSSLEIRCIYIRYTSSCVVVVYSGQSTASASACAFPQGDKYPGRPGGRPGHLWRGGGGGGGGGCVVVSLTPSTSLINEGEFTKGIFGKQDT
jgi:hypothetical protein